MMNRIVGLVLGGLFVAATSVVAPAAHADGLAAGSAVTVANAIADRVVAPFDPQCRVASDATAESRTASPSVAAKVAAAVSPFSGTYVGALPPVGTNTWAVSDRGTVTTAWEYCVITLCERGSARGSVTDDGRLTVRSSRTECVTWGCPGRKQCSCKTYNVDIAATVTLDASSNIVGTTDTGDAFIWVRQ
jgi:hypothetical protein